MDDWQPGATLSTLRLRAKLLASTREFFTNKGVLEVETSTLSRFGTTDVYLNSIKAGLGSVSNCGELYLQTSPELQMKRLLAMGVGPIYQICKAFRDDPVTSLHNPEFTIVEWYRPSFSMENLMNEVEEYVQTVVSCGKILRYSYQEVFEEKIGLNPHECSLDEIQKAAHTHLDIGSKDLRFTEYLDLVMSEVVEPNLPEFCFLYDYPECQAAMATIEIDDHGNQIAKRFELYCKGIEIANGYFELTDPVEQLRRLTSDNIERSKKGLPEIPIDERFFAALSAGIPKGSGVALGLDRLLMVMGDFEEIDSVLSFSIKRV